jgi:hypothetical protein
MARIDREERPSPARRGGRGADPVAHDLTQLAKLGAYSDQAAHALIWANPSLASAKVQKQLGVSLKTKPDQFLDAVAPSLSNAYLTFVARHQDWLAQFPQGFAATPFSGSVKLDSAQSIIDEVDAKAGAMQRKLPQAKIDLIGDRVWALRDQHGTPTCVAYAAAACVELKEARAGTPTTKPKRYSTRHLYRNMRRFGFTQNLQSALWQAGGTKFEFTRGALLAGGVLLEEFCRDFYESADWSAVKADFDAAAPLITAKAKKPYPKPAYFVDYLKVPRAAGEALRVFGQLQQGRAVGVAVPGFADQKAIDKSIWRSPDFWLTGILPTPLPTQLAGDTGHAVCIVGFLPNTALPAVLPKDDFGGYFAFRNSWGDIRFGRESPAGLSPGYGLMPARIVEYFALEAISF